ncbi:hypothetical protein V3595_24465 [Bacillus sp. CFBP9009]
MTPRTMRSGRIEKSALTMKKHKQDLVVLYDFHSRHSLSAGGPGASSALFAPAGSPLDTFFPQESRTFRSNQLECFF